MFIGICHDLAESVVGDIPTYANVPKVESINEFRGLYKTFPLIHCRPEKPARIKRLSLY